VIETALVRADPGPTQMGGDRSSVDTELHPKLSHRPASPVAGDQGVDLGRLQWPSGPRLASRCRSSGLRLLMDGALRSADVQVYELA
jgi:hypothetical protein